MRRIRSYAARRCNPRLPHLPWAGEKAAIRHLMAADPEFLGHIRACLAEQDRAWKVAFIESPVARALAPAGPLWQAGAGVYVPGTYEVSGTF